MAAAQARAPGGGKMSRKIPRELPQPLFGRRPRPETDRAGAGPSAPVAAVARSPARGAPSRARPLTPGPGPHPRRGRGGALTSSSRDPCGAGGRQPRSSSCPAHGLSEVCVAPALEALLSPWPRDPNFPQNPGAGSFRASRRWAGFQQRRLSLATKRESGPGAGREEIAVGPGRATGRSRDLDSTQTSTGSLYPSLRLLRGL